MERDLSGVKVAAPAELLAEEGLTKKLLPAAKSEGYGSCKSLTTVLGEVDAAITFHSLQVICLFFFVSSLHFISVHFSVYRLRGSISNAFFLPVDVVRTCCFADLFSKKSDPIVL